MMGRDGTYLGEGNSGMSVKDEVIAAIQNYLPLSVKPSQSSTELDYICGLDGGYRKLACLQAAEGQLIRLSMTDRAIPLRTEIKALGEQLAAQEVKAYNDKQAWVTEYGDYKYGAIKNPQQKLKSITAPASPDVAWKPFDCEKCTDTGWITNFDTTWSKGMKVPCSCELGTEKAKKKEVYDKAAQDYKANKIKEQQELSNKQQQLKHELTEHQNHLADLKKAIETEKAKLKEESKGWFGKKGKESKMTQAQIAELETMAGALEVQISNAKNSLGSSQSYQSSSQEAIFQKIQQLAGLGGPVTGGQLAKLIQAKPASTLVTPPAPKGPPELATKGRRFR